MNVSRIDEMIMRLEGLNSLERKEIEELQLKKLNALLKKFKDVVYVTDDDFRGLDACYRLMEKLDNVSYLIPPKRKGIKDINDILQGKDPIIKSVDDLLRMGWLENISKSKENLKQIINMTEKK